MLSRDTRLLAFVCMHVCVADRLMCELMWGIIFVKSSYDRLVSVGVSLFLSETMCEMGSKDFRHWWAKCSNIME